MNRFRIWIGSPSVFVAYNTKATSHKVIFVNWFRKDSLLLPSFLVSFYCLLADILCSSARGMNILAMQKAKQLRAPQTNTKGE